MTRNVYVLMRGCVPYGVFTNKETARTKVQQVIMGDWSSTDGDETLWTDQENWTISAQTMEDEAV